MKNKPANKTPDAQPRMTKSAREALATKKAKRRPKEDFNQAAFRAIQETIKRSG